MWLLKKRGAAPMSMGEAKSGAQFRRLRRLLSGKKSSPEEESK
jgi:hypothetical protein